MRTMLAAVLLVASTATAHVGVMDNFEHKPILADLNDLRALNIPVLAKDESMRVGYTVVNPEMLSKIQERSHSVGKCGGFEDLSHDLTFSTMNFENIFTNLANIQKGHDLYERAPFKALTMERKEVIASALQEVDPDNLRAYVTWLSSFPNRYEKDASPNKHVEEMKVRLEAMMGNSSLPFQIEVVPHTSTKQNSLIVRLVGKEKPNEIVVLGGHLDSIVQSGWGGGGGKIAPGADDNASGSANLIEALRILSAQPQPKRTIEFMWYAGEESGLLGSAEIAQKYKREKKDVIAVLQLDMTLYAGSGEFVLGSMTDFTSPWLRDYLKAMNETYINARIVDDKCGYGCSDHASWHRQGYPAVMPFEATFRQSNKNIHTVKDVISPESNFKHSAMFSKIAVVLGMELANSDARQPYQ